MQNFHDQWTAAPSPFERAGDGSFRGGELT
jgi:hypothetical protein